jgi:hypothetical protein
MFTEKMQKIWRWSAAIFVIDGSMWVATLT